MNREADYTLKGFIYQFNKTLEQLLSEPDGSEITVEGIIEDIDVTSGSMSKAIQCKYHETKDTYSISTVSKPILQMMVHYSANKTSDIKYILYAFFPNEKEGLKNLVQTDIEEILKTKNKKYIVNYISKLKPPTDLKIKGLLAKQKRTAAETIEIKDYYIANPNLPLIVDINDFLKKDRFRFEIGKSFEELVKEIKKLLEANSSFSEADVNDIFYPNAIQIIADKSIIHDPLERVIEKSNFITFLEKTKKTVLSRWTKELASYKALLKKRRTQLQSNLQENHRARYLVFDSLRINHFDDEIVTFIDDYIAKYNCKVKLHSETPLVCIHSKKPLLIHNIEKRLYSKDVKFENGFRGQTFYQNAFLREPKKIDKENWCEFHLRIGEFSDDIKNAMNSKKCDDLFIVGRLDLQDLDLQDVNVEYLDISNFEELRYLLKLSDNIE